MQVVATRCTERDQVRRLVAAALCSEHLVVDVELGAVLALPTALAPVAVAAQDIRFDIVKILLGAHLVAGAFNVGIHDLVDVEGRQFDLPASHGHNPFDEVGARADGSRPWT